MVVFVRAHLDDDQFVPHLAVLYLWHTAPAKRCRPVLGVPKVR
uniref:Uncharacterized protein n=1 Tax=Arundo donax TaxID=35708 RepID=A0A0A9C801_ARUDO